MTIAAVLDHRLAEAQRLGLRVKGLKVREDEWDALVVLARERASISAVMAVYFLEWCSVPIDII